MSMSITKGCSLGALVLAGAVSFGGCRSASVRATVYVPTRPPVALREAIEGSPGPGYVWVPGYHQWDGGHFVWVSGRWERPPRARARWRNGHWRQDRHGWYWVEGRWR